MRKRTGEKQRPQEKRAIELLDGWLARRTSVALSLHLNIGILSFLGEVFQRQGESFWFRDRGREFAFVFSPIGSERIRIKKNDTGYSLEFDTHRYLIEGIKPTFYDSIVLYEIPAVTKFLSPEELASTIRGATH
jgi:hypothetical protein